MSQQQQTQQGQVQSLTKDPASLLHEEPSIGEFFNNSELSDIVVLDNNGKQQKKYQLHRVILASKSTYFRKLFKEKPNQQEFVLPLLVQLEINKMPQQTFIQQNQNQNFKETNIIESVLKFIYSDYDFAVLTNQGLNALNCMDFFSYFSTLQVNSGIFLMEKYILQYILNSENALQILNIGIQFKNKALLDNSVKLVSEKFGKLLQNSQYFYSQLLDLSYDAFLQIIQSSDIQVENEDIILSIVHDYIVQFQSKNKQLNQQNNILQSNNHTKEGNINQIPKILVQPLNEISKEQQVQNDEKQIDLEKNNESEQQNQNEKSQNMNNPTKAQEAEISQNSEKEPPKDKLQSEVQNSIDQIQNNNEQKQIQNDQNAIDNGQNLENNQNQKEIEKDETLPKQQEANDQNNNQEQDQKILIEQSSQNQAKDSNQLKNQDETIKIQQQLDLNDKSLHQQNNNQQLNNQQLEELLSFVRLGYVSHSALNYFAQQPVFLSQRDIFYKAISLKLSKYEQNNMPNYSGINWNPRESYMNNVTLLNPANIETHHNLRQGNQIEKPSIYPNSSQFGIQNNQQLSYYQQSNKQFFSESSYNNQQKYVKPNQSGSLAFTYAYDFDENGLLFFLGSKGNKIQFSNPFYLNEVMPFCSSLKLGRIEDLTARLNNNTISTENEKNSFFGFDLGEDRYFFPTCYTLRNRSMPSCILFNWLLEGSNDNKQWFEIDKRIHFSKDSKYNLLLEKERELLRKPNKSSTWGIDTSKLKETLRTISIDAVGFRAFRITQLSTNGSNTHEFAIGAIEFYGKAYGMNWQF
ncbi:BTB And carboxy-terminal kelch protein (macronuclear) [Tetrahymena thermophila SB210]|uniref:BTB And carboxy-terminal kelch protein n=1 Tax=Tetrahymena thermophila (strain SB210) TaxID=312017 RepID=Q22GC4_TETTS|nr:BTB And carboxy-terminal kelch protein [Tetrahymena thermophila SB210]EAR84407.4 BTB And carboxy-terminal kelch protein [Tetrahymena thermophila SB210]|eukprot:XP_001032070.4 BTB And carboxy-terminal kelch protein [Tetrahymena thermophila SB210]